MANYLTKALLSYPNFCGCLMPTDPTNQEELDALEPSGGRDHVWTGTAPTWEEIQAKMVELESADNAKRDAKISAYQKLGLTEEEIQAIL